jgi:hypothetical protein
MITKLKLAWKILTYGYKVYKWLKAEELFGLGA